MHGFSGSPHDAVCICLVVALTGLPIGYSVIVALTGFPIRYSVIVALTGLPIRYSVIVALTGLPIGYSVIGASLSEPHTSESPRQILVLSTMHKKLRQKSDNLCVRREIQRRRLQRVLIWFV